MNIKRKERIVRIWTRSKKRNPECKWLEFILSSIRDGLKVVLYIPLYVGF